MLKPLKYPYPYKAWLTISNDPDNTAIEAWHELNEFIFNELKLDWANTVFIYNYNLNLPDQVSLASHPEIANQPIDALHTWGDFVHAGQRGFSRQDAEDGIKLLETMEIKPRIWVDHSRFTGNLLHNNAWGAIPTHEDSSGNTYKVFEYTLDIIKEQGIAYVWDGKLTQNCGQDRDLKLLDHLQHYSALGKIRFLLLNGFKFLLPGFDGLKKSNKQLKKHKFPDGNTLYTFKRFGNWRDADILGLANVLSEKNINALLKNGGTMVAYTHLGKTNPVYKGETHIPEVTKKALRNVKQKADSQELLFSSLSKMLDYLVLRDHVVINGESVVFKPDGIRFEKLTEADLVGQTFSFHHNKNSTKLTVEIEGKTMKPNISYPAKDIVSITF